MSCSVLVVDDSVTARNALRHILESGGYSVREAHDGMAALEEYALEKPEVVLLDLVMKGMYGLDVLNKLRELDPSARIIVATADVQHSTRDLAYTGGAHGVINKPFVAEQVLDAVKNVLGDEKRTNVAE